MADVAGDDFTSPTRGINFSGRSEVVSMHPLCLHQVPPSFDANDDVAKLVPSEGEPSQVFVKSLQGLCAPAMV